MVTVYIQGLQYLFRIYYNGQNRNFIVISRYLQQKHPFLMVNIVLRVHVVRMVLKHPLVDKRITQQAGPFQRRDRYSHLKQIWYHIARFSIYLSSVPFYENICMYISVDIPFLAGLGLTKYLPSSRVKPLSMKTFSTS